MVEKGNEPAGRPLNGRGQPFAAQAPVAKGLDVAQQMSPADLTPGGIDESVALESIGHQRAGERAEQLLRHRAGPPGTNQKDGHLGGGRQPQPHLLARLLPAGLVGVDHGLMRDGGLERGHGLGQRLAGSMLELADAADRHRDPN